MKRKWLCAADKRIDKRFREWQGWEEETMNWEEFFELVWKKLLKGEVVVVKGKKKRKKDEDRIWRGIRNSKIKRRFKEGDSAKRLGKEFGLHVGSIYRILAAKR